jgi:hypothetical protein
MVQRFLNDKLVGNKEIQHRYREGITDWLLFTNRNTNIANWCSQGTFAVPDGSGAIFSVMDSEWRVEGYTAPRSAGDVARLRENRYGYKREHWATIDALNLSPLVSFCEIPLMCRHRETRRLCSTNDKILNFLYHLFLFRHLVGLCSSAFHNSDKFCFS